MYIVESKAENNKGSKISTIVVVIYDWSLLLD